MAAKDERGRAGEARATEYLRQAGYAVADRNWRCADGEVDIVALCPGRVVVVEVKTRRSAAYGHPFEAITSRKLTRLWRLGGQWMRAHPARARGRVLRVDGIAITGADVAAADLEHLRDLR